MAKSKMTLDIASVITGAELNKYARKVANSMLRVKYKGYYGSEVSPTTLGYKRIKAAVNKVLVRKVADLGQDKDVAAYATKVARNMCLRWFPDKDAQKKIDKILNKHLEDYISNMTQRQKDALIVKHLTIKS